MKIFGTVLLFTLLLCTGERLHAQVPPATDTVPAKKDTISSAANDTLKQALKITSPITVDSAAIKDSIARKKHSPHVAAVRSALIPGWGQIYNKKYWKVPIVYTAIGIPVGTFLYNRKWYIQTRNAAEDIANGNTSDTTKNKYDPKLHIFFENPNSLGALLNYRNDFRRNMDYSILFVLLFWGVNVVDATVDAHLWNFNVSDDLSLRIKPTLLKGSTTAGLSFVFTIGKTKPENYHDIRF
jgi:hypothetical protein